MKLTIKEHVASDGRSPFRDWLDALDLSVKARIQARVLRFETGNLGDHKSVGGGVWEARLMFGPGYRIYLGKPGRSGICFSSAAQKDLRPRTFVRHANSGENF
jgi:putative addiction module killer protein